MEKYVVEVYELSETDSGRLKKKFLGFWHEVDDKPDVYTKGSAIQIRFMDKAETDFTVKMVGGIPIGTVTVGDREDGFEFRIIPESQSKHKGGGDYAEEKT